MIGEIVSLLVKLAAEAPGLAASITGHRTDEEAIAHVRALLAAQDPLGARFAAAAEHRRAELEAEEAARAARADEPTRETRKE